VAIVEYAIEYGVKPASRRFGLERKTIRRWGNRWRAEGLAGLAPRYPVQRPSRLFSVVKNGTPEGQAVRLVFDLRWRR
jgi:transposase